MSKLLRYLIRDLAVVEACSEGGEWKLTLYRMVFRRGEARFRSRKQGLTTERFRTEKIKGPLIVVLRGTGIITKIVPERGELFATITASGEFVWAAEKFPGASAADTGSTAKSGTAGQESRKEPVTADGEIRLTFMRRQLWDSLKEQLGPSARQLVATHIGPEGRVEDEVKGLAANFFGNDLTLKTLFIPSEEGTRLASLAASRLLLPVLACVFLALTVNYFVGSGLRKTVGLQQSELNLIRQNATVRQKETADRKKIETLYLHSDSRDHSLIADRIAAAVPPGIMLTGLTINPLEKKIIGNKPLQIIMNRVVVRGESPAPEPVTQFTEALGSLKFVQGCKLLSYEKDRSGNYRFEIEIELNT